MKILIIEDEVLAAEKLYRLLHEYDPQIDILATLSSIKHTRQWLEENASKVDLILMDIRVSDGLIFEVFQDFPISLPVIFITAYDQYAIQAFKNNGIDYLLKPIDFQELKSSLDRYKARYSADSETPWLEKFEALMKDLHKKEYKTRFLVKSGQKLIPVSTQQLAYFYKDDIVLLVTLSGQKYAVNYSLDELERQLDPKVFFRINRQFIIQTEAIESIHQYFKGKLKLSLKPKTLQEIIISQEKSALFKVWLDQ